ncbi:HTTM domain-containing protein [Streptomyces sp. NPDC049954]|uniref:HTTM domain-containing protein n=1 Tax=Streptomyces sp. NPDC049954 TaxID=3155779 RepID=UPI00343EF765
MWRAGLGRALGQVSGRALGPYQSAVVRIGFSATWLAFLLRELPHRDELYGLGSPWGPDLAARLLASNHAFTVLPWFGGQLWFELVYGLAMLSAALLLLGWRTRTASVLFMIGVLSLQNRSVFMGDGGDNVIHLMAIYLVFTRCGQVWSLDARRRARGGRDRAGPPLWAVSGLVLALACLGGRLTGGWSLALWGLWSALGVWWLLERRAARPVAGFHVRQLRALADVVGNAAHNAGLLVVMGEACLIYATAGWYKIQGSRWQDGTAVHYPLRLEYFSPWPALSEALAAHGTLITLVTYGTVLVQVAFPFALFNRRVKNVLLVGMMAEHVGIAVILGLPFFSLAMIAADAVFLPTGFLRRTGGVVGGVLGHLTARPRGVRGGAGRSVALPGPRAAEPGEEAGRSPVGFRP